jgi:hypothetical protein
MQWSKPQPMHIFIQNSKQHYETNLNKTIMVIKQILLCYKNITTVVCIRKLRRFRQPDASSQFAPYILVPPTHECQYAGN